MSESEEVTKKFPRDSSLVIAAEQLKQNYDELLRAGFTKAEALTYLSSLMANLMANLRKDKQ